MFKLDYRVSTLEERKKIVEDICNTETYLSGQQKKYLADYLLFSSDAKQTQREKKEEYPFITDNRRKTTNKRETSLEEIIMNLQNGEDGLYALIKNDKNQLMDPREKITQDDIDTIPQIAERLDIIKNLEKQLQKVTGKKRYDIKRQIIDTYKDIYIIKQNVRGISAKPKINTQLQAITKMELPETVTFDDNGLPHAKGFSLMNPQHVSILLNHYSKLKQDSYEDFLSDMKYMLMDLEDVTDRALRDYPMLYDLLILRIDGCKGKQIMAEMERLYGVQHSQQYYSTLWCQKIPKLIALQARKDYMTWYYTYQKPLGHPWKRCGKCGRTLLAHTMFFSPNSSLDGLYSVCRDCRKGVNKYGKTNLQ